MRWLFGWGRYPAGGYLDVPLWFPLILAILPTAFAWRLDTLARRRARVGLCAHCHYDRRGLVAGVVCPECGGGPL